MSSASPGTWSCPVCGRANPLAAPSCQSCGAQPPPSRWFAPGPVVTPPSSAPLLRPPALGTGPPGVDYGRVEGSEPRAKDRERTSTGLLMMTIGFVIGWIPYVSYVGGVLLLVGIILLFLGRNAYGEEHRRSLMAGATLYVVAFVGTLVATFALAAAIFDDAITAGVSVASAAASLGSALLGYFVAEAFCSALVLIAYVLVLRRLAAPRVQRVLWVAAAVGIVIQVGELAYLLPLVGHAISSAGSGTSLNLGPVTQLETVAALLGTLTAVPFLLFAWSYNTTRHKLQD